VVKAAYPVLQIHGNSSRRGVFLHQLQGPLAENHRLIVFDLPGHGQSSNALDPTRSYTLPGLADAAVELLEKLDVNEAVVFGWSLGGHIGIEMVPRFPGMRGLMITGAPPVGPNNMAQGFNSSPQTGHVNFHSLKCSRQSRKVCSLRFAQRKELTALRFRQM
jgi:pimeloyl-ACP methyl ester carboxylesterase